jgi:hypothetical protein
VQARQAEARRRAEEEAFEIQLPDASFANNYGIAAAGASISDPSGFEFPEGVSTIFFRVIDESGMYQILNHIQ